MAATHGFHQVITQLNGNTAAWDNGMARSYSQLSKTKTTQTSKTTMQPRLAKAFAEDRILAFTTTINNCLITHRTNSCRSGIGARFGILCQLGYINVLRLYRNSDNFRVRNFVTTIFMLI